MSAISIKNSKGEFELFEIPWTVRDYIIKLEMHILSPNNSKLMQSYPERFNQSTIDEMKAKHE